jgi:hypothetical protein
MIAQRFRALGWVAGIASAATGLYLISLQVAAERAKLEAVDRRIAAAHRDMRQLQTELGTRASMRQLQKWNEDVLSMDAPRAQQYLQSEVELASLSPDRTLPAGVPVTPRATLVAAAPKPVVPAETARPVITPSTDEPRIRQANYTPPSSAAAPRIERVAMVDKAVIDRSTLGDLLRTAAQERRKRP